MRDHANAFSGHGCLVTAGKQVIDRGLAAGHSTQLASYLDCSPKTVDRMRSCEGIECEAQWSLRRFGGLRKFEQDILGTDLIGLSITAFLSDTTPAPHPQEVEAELRHVIGTQAMLIAEENAILAEGQLDARRCANELPQIDAQIAELQRLRTDMAARMVVR